MSSDSSFEGQVLHEFDDLLPKPFPTDSDSDHLDVESTCATISSQAPPLTIPTSCQTSIPPSTPGITDSLFSLEISPVESTDCLRPRYPYTRFVNELNTFFLSLLRGRKRMGRPRKRIYARRHKVRIPIIGEDTLSQLQDPIPNTPKHSIHKFSKTHPRRGYIAKFRVPRTSYPRSVHFSKRDSKKIASTPTGMRLLDIGVLAEVFSTLRCNECNNTLALYEDQWKHNWQTFFRVKCQRCHSEHATFPSSRSLDIPSHHTCVNVPFTPNDMNEVTMRSVLATHSTGMSWRD